MSYYRDDMRAFEHGLYALIRILAEKYPTKTALLSCGKAGMVLQEITYDQLLTRLEASASYLQSIGITRGDAVALDFGNSPEFLILSWAAWCSGIITVPLDTKRDTEELRKYKITKSRVKKVLTEKDSALVANFGTPAWLSDVSQEALILFTSGTTAYPKGARLTLENLLVNAESIGEWLHIGEADRFLVQLPLHHINSTTFCLSALIRGASIALSPGYSNSHFWRQAAGSGATITSIVQSILFDQLHRTEEYQEVKSSLKLSRIQIGSAPVVPSSVKEFREKFSISLYQGYGQTETALRVTGVPMNLSQPLYEALVAENSIGEAMLWADLRIMNEKGAILGEEEEGELVVKGPAVMKGYVADEPAFRDGYFLTGDIGYYKDIEGHRFFYLKGRKKEIIIKGGINISPTAIENSLKRISDDIDQAYVVAVPDARYGEEVATTIVFKPDCDHASAMRRLKCQLLFGSPWLSAYETPKYLSSISVEQLPLTSTGKVQRIVLKERPLSVYESLYDILQTSQYQFVVLTLQSPHLEASLTLYNHCWQPLTVTMDSYKESVKKQFTLLALEADGTLAGQISFRHDGTTLTCTSICSAAFTPKPIPHIAYVPTPEQVEEYLLSGYDGIFNFHAKMGASLVRIVPHGRPEDKSSLGYTMLLSYPPTKHLAISQDAPVSSQLITAVRLLAEDMHFNVEALSRPGGLAAYLSRTN